MKSAIVLKHLAFYFWAISWTFMVSVCIIPLLVCPSRWSFLLSRIWAKGIFRGAKYALGLTHRVEGVELLPKKGPYILASKHQSVWETLVFSTLVENPTFFMKKSLFSIPLVGWFFWKLDMIPVSRGRKSFRNRVDFIEITRTVGVQKCRPIVIFPEGTRSALGTDPTYYKGVFFLYRKLDIPVIPVALNSGAFWARRTFFKKPGIIILRFLPPMPQGLTMPVFMKDLKATVEETSKRLLALKVSG